MRDLGSLSSGLGVEEDVEEDAEVEVITIASQISCDN